ncbi:MAG TPA: HAD-IA family hydrolase [Clostridiales bacterium]|nr:HAD-IA family hydrolase [Clostridiales bacterium]
MKDTIIFDLDGTLVNTLPDLTAALNHSLVSLGREPFAYDAVQSLVGRGFERLIYAAFGEVQELEKAGYLFKSYYAKHNCDESKPYDGMVELLKKLKEENYKLGVCTNKGHHDAVNIINHFFPNIFEYVLGESDNFVMKPEPDMLLHVIKKVGGKPENAVFIGDSRVDYQTSLAANVMDISVTWGFELKEVIEQDGAKRFIDHPSELWNFIN